ncbi:VOC family protein [Comamonas sp.]|uniref:VOC family protein n=1 Tax=Comamonas sp. TaxID=34028 RepID=UPI003A92FD5C
MAMNPVGWFEIYVQDMQRAKAFYEAVLNYQLQALPMPEGGEHPDMEMWAFPGQPDQAGATGALVHMAGCPSGGGGGTMVYFVCEDCAEQAARVTQNGGSLQREKVSIGQYGFIALATDTEGNMFGLHSMK